MKCQFDDCKNEATKILEFQDKTLRVEICQNHVEPLENKIVEATCGIWPAIWTVN